MEAMIRRRYSQFIALYSALLLTVTSAHCSKPALSEDTQVVPLHSRVDLTCPACRGRTWWGRHNRTTNLQDGPRLSLESVGYKDEDDYTCYRNTTPACTVQLLVEDDLEKPRISCYIRHPAHNITCDWQPTRELRPHARVTLIAWMLNGMHSENLCHYTPSTGKFTCSTLYKEGDSSRHILSLCVIGRTDSRTSNVVDSTIEKLVQPDPPIDIMVASLEGHSRRLRVSWSPPDLWLNDFYKLEYQVQYRVEGSQLVSNGTTEETHFVIHDALARRRHVIRVRAKEEFFLTWSAWSEEAVGAPWSEEEVEPSGTTDFEELVMTSPEEEDPEKPEMKKSSPPIPQYVWFVLGSSFSVLLLLFLGILMRNREMKVLKLKGGLLRTFFQAPRSSPTVPQPLSAEPFLMTPCPQVKEVTVAQPRGAD